MNVPCGPARAIAGLALCAAAAAGCANLHSGAESSTAAPDWHAVVAAADRTEADRQTDVRREPERLMSFTGARPGMRVLDVGAGAGYSTELLARGIGPAGVVYAQDAPDAADSRAGRAFQERAKKPVMANVVRLLSPYDALPGNVRDLDLVTVFFAYHDTAYMPVDRARMDRGWFDALKPGGTLVVADHAARPGAGTTVTKSLHRIEQQTVERELEAAGFRLVAESDSLRHPDDPRDSVVFRSPVPVDEFVLKFEKPR